MVIWLYGYIDNFISMYRNNMTIWQYNSADNNWPTFLASFFGFLNLWSSKDNFTKLVNYSRKHERCQDEERFDHWQNPQCNKTE